MTEIVIGRVTSRDGARDHLSIVGLASCGAGRGRVFPDTARRLTDQAVTAADRICRRCRPAILRAIAAASRTAAAAEDRYSDATVNTLSTWGAALDPTTPARAAREAQMVAEMRTTLAGPVDPRQAAWDRFDAYLADPASDPTPATVTVPVGVGTIERSARPLSGWGVLRARYAAN